MDRPITSASALPVLADEAARLAALRALMVLDSAHEPLFDAIALQASVVCGVPIALLSFVDAQRQWFKANVGLAGADETPRDVAFCAHAIADDALFEVADATSDPRFADNPLVRGDPHIRFYAGAPLVLPGGERVGTLCVIDRQSRHLDAGQAAALRSLAELATHALVMRQQLILRSLSARDEYEVALARSEARHRSLVEHQSELVSLANADGELVYVNKAYAAQFGQEPGSMVGRNLFEFVQPADRAGVQAQMDAVFASGQAQRGENRMAPPGPAARTDHWVAWTNTLHYEPGSGPLLHSVGRDVSERKYAEDALRASRSFLLRTNRVAGVGGWEVDVASGTITWSDETRRIHGVGPDYTPVLQSAIEFYAPEARPVIEAAIQAGLAHGTPWDLELGFVTAAGCPKVVRVVGEVEFEAGRAIRLVGAFQDVTERTRMEARLAESERFTRQITDNLPQRIGYIDAERRYRFVNQAFCERFGLPREEIIGKTRIELRPDPSNAVVDARMRAALAGTVQHFEFDEGEGAEVRRIEALLIPDVDRSGRVAGFYTTGADVTVRTRALRDLNELTAILDNSPDLVVQTDWRGAIVYMNPAVRELVGVAADADMRGRSFAEFNTPATNALFASQIMPAVKAAGVWLGETTVLAQGGREMPVNHMVIAHRDASGRIGRYSAVMRDISHELRAKRQLERQAATLRSVTESIPAVVAVVGADYRYRFVNHAFERWSGTQRDQVIGWTLPEVLGRAEYERSRPWIERVLAGETVTFEKSYAQSGRRDHHLSISYIPLWLESGEVDGFVAVAQDISTQRQESVRLRRLAHHDPLTGVLNRAGFDDYLAQRLGEGGGPALAILCIDLDRFKPVNDRHGHPVGDQVLRMFAARLVALVRPTDAVARLGGDEFAIALAGVRDIEGALGVADKVVAAAGSPFQIGSLELEVGSSVGVAFGARVDAGWAELVGRADQALYSAKNAGRGRHAAESAQPATEPPGPT